MKIHTKAVILTALTASILSLTSPAQAVVYQDGKVPLYYADHTTRDWRLWDAVRRWNKNDRVELTEVVDCTPDLVPCATIIDKPLIDVTAWTVPNNNPRTIEGITNWNGVGHTWDNPTIELYTWWVDERVDDTLDWRMERLACHELGHYVMQTSEHPTHGCLSNDHSKLVPGKWLRARIPSWRTSDY
jgi:hypothetical protein